MKQRKLYFKTDFKIWERCDCGFDAPFRFTYFTSSLRCGVVASYDGHEYHGCRLMEDGRLCVAFDDHGLGLGVLRVERRFYLTDTDYASGVCDEVYPPTPVTCEDGGEQYNLCLSLDGALGELNVSSVLPPYYMKGEDAKINGLNSINIVGEAVKQEGDTLTIDAYEKSTVDSLLGDKVSSNDEQYTKIPTIERDVNENKSLIERLDEDKATREELQNSAQGLGQSISSVGALAGSNAKRIEAFDGGLQLANAKIATAQASIDYIANSVVPNMQDEISSAKTTAEDAKTAAENAANNLPLKQDKLVSGENIKTINSQSIVGSGNVDTFFTMQYGVTTFNDVLEAFNAGKTLYLYNHGTYEYAVSCVYDKNVKIFVFTILHSAYEVRTCILNSANQWSEHYTLLGEQKKLLTSDKSTLVNAINSLKLQLDKITPSGDLQHYMYEQIGAIYNDTDSDIVRDAPWADLVDDDNPDDKYVTHKAGYWYMNGLGDLTNYDMRNILLYGKYVSSTSFSNSSVNIRTCWNKFGNNISNDYGFAFDYTLESIPLAFLDGNSSLIWDCRKLKYVYYIRGFSGTCYNNFSLQYFGFGEISKNVDIRYSPLLSIKSILYMIQNAQTTNNFTITLHDDAYTRAMQNAEVLVALEAKPNITLASASS